MTLYKAKKDGIGFYIQPDMIGEYAKQGYEILKTEEVPVTDIRKEMETAQNTFTFNPGEVRNEQ